MKNWLSLVYVAVLGLSLVGCATKSAPPPEPAVPESEMPSPESMDTTNTAPK